MSLTRLKPTGVNNTAQFNMANLSVQGNISAGNIKTDNLLYANGVAWDLQQAAGASSQIQFNNNNNFDASANLTFNKSTKTLTTDTLAGNVTGNLTGTVLTASQPQITSVGSLTSLTVTGDGSFGGNVTVTGNLTVSGTTTTINSTVIEVADTSLVLARNATTPVQANGAGIIINGAGANFTYNSTSNALVSTHKISADGSLLTALNGSNVTGRVANANVAYTVANAAQPNITSVGTLTGLVVNGEIDAQVVSAPILSGTLSDLSNAQPNITSLGTLLDTTLGASNSFTGGNLISANYFTGTLTTHAQPNITSVGTLLNTTMGSANSLTGGNLVSATYIQGNGSLLTSLNASNVSTGTIPSSILGNSTVYLGTTGIALNRTSASQSLTGITSIDGYAVTVSASAQPNITSVGTLTNTTLGASNSFTGGNLISANYFTGTLTTAAQPNITSVGTITNLTAGNISVNANANVAGWFISSQSQESFVDIGSVSYASAVTHNLSLGTTFYHTTASANFTANFTNVPTTAGRSTVVTLVIVQGATPYIPNAVQIDGVAQTIKWPAGIIPLGRANSTDIVSFGLFRTSSGWVQVLGSYSTYS